MCAERSEDLDQARQELADHPVDPQVSQGIGAGLAAVDRGRTELFGRAAGDVRLKDGNIAALRPKAAHRDFRNLLFFLYVRLDWLRRRGVRQMTMSESAETLHFCVHGGFVVGGDGWLPQRSWDYHWGSITPDVGCNNLICDECHQRVRQRRGLEVASGQRVGPDELKGADPSHWHTIEALEASAVGRIYACHCKVRVAFAPRATNPPDDELHGLHTAWKCAGHPALSLPLSLEGVAVAGDGSDDWDSLVDATLTGALPDPAMPIPGHDHKRHPAFWLARLPMLVDSLPVARAVAERASARLSSDDVQVRKGAVNFYRYHPNALGVRRLAELMETRPELFKGVKDPDRPRRTLERYANEVLDRRLSMNAPEAVAFARREVEAGRARRAHVYRLALLDVDWLRDRRDDIVARQPELEANVDEAIAGF